MVINRVTSLGLSRDERGSVGIIFGLVLTILVISGGAAIDYGFALRTREKLQVAVDAAALAGSSAPQDTLDQERHTIALNVFNANKSGDPYSSVTPQILVEGTTVTVNSSSNVPTNFLRIMNITAIPVSVTSKAASSYSASATPGGAICLLALDPASPDGLHIQGTNALSYPNCWAHTNSTLATAINAVGSVATATGAGHCAVGGYASIHSNFAPAPTTGCAAVPDPYATGSAYATPSTYAPTFTPPTVGTNCTMSSPSFKKGSYTLEPGRYCGGIDIKAQATVTLNPGIYIIDNGTLNVQAGGSLTGSNVLFYFVGANAHLTIIGGGTVNLKGRASGSSLAGFLFIAHPDAWNGNTSNIQGGGTFNLEGMLYMPTQRIEVGGNGAANGSSQFFGMVAKDFYFIGNGTFDLKVRQANATVPDIMPLKPATQAIAKVALR